MARRVYLAGPDVFLLSAKEIGEAKKTLCAKYGFEGVFPLDLEVDTVGKSPRDVGLLISEVNENLLRSCDIVVANVTPFRGPSADVGTAYEMGYAHALGKKIFAYSNAAAPFTKRVVDSLGVQVTRSQDQRLRDNFGMFLEEMDLVDNLMLDGCVHVSTGCIVVGDAPADQLYTYLGYFEKCLELAKEKIK